MELKASRLDSVASVDGEHPLKDYVPQNLTPQQLQRIESQRRIALENKNEARIKQELKKLRNEKQRQDEEELVFKLSDSKFDQYCT